VRAALRPGARIDADHQHPAAGVGEGGERDGDDVAIQRVDRRGGGVGCLKGS